VWAKYDEMRIALLSPLYVVAVTTPVGEFHITCVSYILVLTRPTFYDIPT